VLVYWVIWENRRLVTWVNRRSEGGTA
jgi:hypothetical protein